MATLLKIVTLLCCIILAHQVWAARLYITRAEQPSAATDQLLQQFRTQLNLHLTDTSIGYILPDAAAGLSGSERLILALGAAALAEVLQGEGNSPVIATFISRVDYETTLRRFPNRLHPVTAVYSDPAPEHQVALTRVLLGAYARLSMIATSAQSANIADAQQAAQRYGVRLQIVPLQPDLNALFAQLSGSQALLLQKDRELFNQLSLDRLLYQAYDLHLMAVIGYSSGLVSNGALATTYVTTEDIVQSVLEVMTHFTTQGSLLPAHFSAHYRLSLNPYVMRSLGLPIQDETSVRKGMTRLLQQQEIRP